MRRLAGHTDVVQDLSYLLTLGNERDQAPLTAWKDPV